AGLTVALLWKLGESLGLNSSMRWLIIALYASQPMTASSLATMQTEGPTSALVVALAYLIQGSDRANSRLLLTASLLFGFLLGLKVSNLVMAGPLGLWMLWRWRQSMPWKMLPLALLCGVAVGGSSYTYAYILTGNPVLPIFNGIFRSPYYQLNNFSNPTWNTGFGWSIVWNMVFHTSRFDEGADGGAGFIPIALSGALLISLFDRRTRPLALAGIVAFLLPLSQTQYFRYATPAFGLLIPAMVSPVQFSFAGKRSAQMMVALLILLVFANFAVVSNTHWQVRTGILQKLVLQGSSSISGEYAPEKKAADFIRESYGSHARTLVASLRYCYGAPFGGRALVRCWYDPALSKSAKIADGDASGAIWRQIFSDAGINLVVLRTDDVTPGMIAAIKESAGIRVYSSGPVEVWELHPAEPGKPVVRASKGIAVQFQPGISRAGMTLLDASFELACLPSKTPIVVGWTLQRHDAPSEGKYGWIYCSSSGQTGDSFHVKSPDNLTGLFVSATPAYGVDLHLVLESASASWQGDLISDRDLAKRWRNGVVDGVKAWNKERLSRRRQASLHRPRTEKQGSLQ
ncbi:MAG: hypothetical protein ABI870_14080, partial [Rhodanobacter sp.]